MERYLFTIGVFKSLIIRTNINVSPYSKVYITPDSVLSTVFSGNFNRAINKISIDLSERDAKSLNMYGYKSCCISQEFFFVVESKGNKR